MVVVGVQQSRCGMAGQGCQRRVGSESVPCPTWAEQRLANRVSSALRGRSKKDPVPRCLSLFSCPAASSPLAFPVGTFEGPFSPSPGFQLS